MSKAIICGWILWLAAVLPAVSYADELSAEQTLAYLEKMSRAQHELNYDLTFTYEYSGYIDTLKWRHRVNQGRETSRIAKLNGAPFSHSRVSDGTECLSLGDRLIRGLFQPFDSADATLFQSYAFVDGGGERIAGRSATVIQIIPRDQYRYGYSLAVDQQTGLLLRLLTLGSESRVLERFQAVAFQQGEQLEPLPGDAASPQTSCVLSSPGLPGSDGNDVWKVDWLPSGFISTGAKHNTEVGRMAVFTDGFSVVSVFVHEGQMLDVGNARAQRGATNIYLEQIVISGQPYLVTVAGEVPLKTAIRIAQSVQLLL